MWFHSLKLFLKLLVNEVNLDSCILLGPGLPFSLFFVVTYILMTNEKLKRHLKILCLGWVEAGFDLSWD